MAYDHEHHQHDTEGMSDSRLIWAIAVNILLTVAQIVGGVIPTYSLVVTFKG